MSKPIHILLQTRIPTTEDDWDIKRYSSYISIWLRSPTSYTSKITT
ncbi:MAG: hypothetical protein DSM106950_39095 [Stigonema ocellatum SAG 48.90 = DSM 106950]|nr:hypothetical protein [Stigonema ocellatum SAG 48.90 = DSM 106950]